jgi:hypothetical protein
MLVVRKKYPFGGSVNEVIVADDSSPVGIAIDMERDHLYWLDRIFGKILRSHLDGSNRTEISTGLSSPEVIALDTVNK